MSGINYFSFWNVFRRYISCSFVLICCCLFVNWNKLISYFKWHKMIKCYFKSFIRIKTVSNIEMFPQSELNLSAAPLKKQLNSLHVLHKYVQVFNFSRTFGIHSFSFPHLLFSLLWERLSCVGEWSARSSTEANMEMRGSGQLSPFSKQQTTCPRPDLCVCLRGSTSTLDKNLLHVLCLAQMDIVFFLFFCFCFVYPILTHSQMDKNRTLTSGCMKLI